MIITALHGFLGRPNDWSTLFHGHALQNKIQAIDLFNSWPILEMRPWAAQLNAHVEKIQVSATPRVMLGYSLGGRLAMHAILQKPELWQAAVIISSHLGLTSVEEKSKRKENDEQWAQRFERDAWENILRDWNGRDVFQNDSFQFIRTETDFSRKTLAAALRQWSLSQQEDLAERIGLLKMPVLWIAGADDHNYVHQTKRLNLQNPRSKVVLVPEAGHRVPWQHTQQFLSELSNFLSQIN